MQDMVGHKLRNCIYTVQHSVQALTTAHAWLEFCYNEFLPVLVGKQDFQDPLTAAF